MVPSDNIFNIYYDIGRALPFEVQRFPKDATDWYKNQSVLVNRQALMRVHRELRNQAPTNTQPESAE